jgi:hypothetical protein
MAGRNQPACRCVDGQAVELPPLLMPISPRTLCCPATLSTTFPLTVSNCIAPTALPLPSCFAHWMSAVRRVERYPAQSAAVMDKRERRHSQPARHSTSLSGPRNVVMINSMLHIHTPRLCCYVVLASFALVCVCCSVLSLAAAMAPAAPHLAVPPRTL